MFVNHCFTKKIRKWWFNWCFNFQLVLNTWHSTVQEHDEKSMAAAAQTHKTSIVIGIVLLTASFSLSAAACCPLRVSPHPAQQVSVSQLLHGWRQAHTYSYHLHCPADLEHSALHPTSRRLSGQTEPNTGHFTCKLWWYWINEGLFIRLVSGNAGPFCISIANVLVFISFFSRLNLQGIGNTAQGAANCIMFVFCTRPIRTRLCATLCCCSKAGASNSQDAPNRLPSGQEPSSKRGEEGTSRVQVVRWYRTHHCVLVPHEGTVLPHEYYRWWFSECVAEGFI